MALLALCSRRLLLLQFAAAVDKADVQWCTPQIGCVFFVKQVEADQPQFALLTGENIDAAALFIAIRTVSPQTLIIICLTTDTALNAGLWAKLDTLDFDSLCTLEELSDCLLRHKSGKVFRSSLLQRYVGYETITTLPGWNELTPT